MNKSKENRKNQFQDIDSSECRQMENALQRESDINKALAELASLLISSQPVAEISNLVLICAKRFTGSMTGYAGYIDSEKGCLICPTLTGEDWGMIKDPDKDIVFKQFTGLWGWVLNNRKPLLINTPSEDDGSTVTPLGRLPIFRFLSVPAIYEGC